MTPVSAPLETARVIGLQLFTRVLGRDNAQLGPVWFSQAAAKRLRTGIRALEAYLRRLLMLLALEMEPHLRPETRERPIKFSYFLAEKSPSKRPRRRRVFTVFPMASWSQLPDFLVFYQTSRVSTGPVEAAPLLTQLANLKALLDAPEARAKRLAFHLARNRPGRILAAECGPGRIPTSSGTEASALYTALGVDLQRSSANRPPQLPPIPRPRPQIRVL